MIATLIAGAALFVGCNKEEKANGIQIFEEGMGGTKVLVDPSSPTTLRSNTWIEGESIKLAYAGGNASFDIYPYQDCYCINPLRDNAEFYDGLTTSNSDNGFFAVYPADIFYSCDGQNLKVWLNRNRGTGIASDRVIRINGKNTATTSTEEISVNFPMVAYGAANTGSIMFKHLTGSAVLKIKNNRATGNYTLSTLKVVYKEVTNGVIFENYIGGIYKYTPTNIMSNTNAVVTVNADENPTESIVFYLRDYNNNPIELEPGESVTVAVWLPVTPHVYSYLNTQDKIDFTVNDNITRSINMTVDRNTMYNLGTFNLFDVVE